MALTNNILGIVNLVGFLLSIPLMGAGIWLMTKQETQCVKFLEWPLILLGGIVLLISLAGFIGACWRVTTLLAIYLFGMVLTILILLALTIFGLVVTNDGQGGQLGYKNYELEAYSPWLQSQVNDALNWRKIKVCLRDEGACQKLRQNYYYLTANGFYSERFSSIEYGCCMPPAECGYQYVNPTYWINPSNPLAERDCSRWSNNEPQLCYDCDSCKAGLLAGVKEEWRKVSVLVLLVLLALIILYVIGCCAVQSARAEQLFKYYLGRY